MVPLRSLSLAFGEIVRDARTAKHLSQEELASRAGVHRTYIGDIENGRKSPTLDVVEGLARALEATPHDLVKAAELVARKTGSERNESGLNRRQPVSRKGVRR